MSRFPVEPSIAAPRRQPAPRPAESFPPCLLQPDMYVDEASGLVMISGRAHQFAVKPTEITLPFAMIEAAFSAILNMRLARNAAGHIGPAPGSGPAPT